MIRIVLYTNVISPHQLPLARELAARVGDDHFRYVYVEVSDKDHGGLGWMLDVPKWCVHVGAADVGAWLENADVLLSGLRCFDLFERRAKKGLKNFYMTERWFKPPMGIARLLHPRYFGYARRLCALMESGGVVGLPIGVHAAKDMARMCGLLHGDMRCFYCVPELEFERRPVGRIWLKDDRNRRRYCLDKMRMWGYFVESSKFRVKRSKFNVDDDIRKHTNPSSQLPTIKVLWVGRLLEWKRVDTIIRAVGNLATGASANKLRDPTHNFDFLKIVLDIYGTGPEEARLKKLAGKYGDAIRFYPPVPIVEVRRLMHEHDVYVLASNGYEGWGAVVNEALEERMNVIGTYEAGASATLLLGNCLYQEGDLSGLMQLLKNKLPVGDIGSWGVGNAAKRLLGCISLVMSQSLVRQKNASGI